MDEEIDREILACNDRDDVKKLMSKLATPKPAFAMNSDMSHVIDDATSTMHDTYDETTSVLDNTVPLGEFLEEQLLKLMILLKMMIMILPLDMNCLLLLRVMLWI